MIYGWQLQLLGIVLLCALSEISSTSQGKKRKKCQDLKELHHDESMYNIPIFLDAFRKTLDYDPDDFERKTSFIFGNKRCPKEISHSCPHHYVMNFDPNRKPAMIFHAHCTCYDCKLSNSKTGGCRPFLHYRFVQERASDDSCFQWRLRGYPVKCFCKEGKSENQGTVPGP